MGTNFYLMTNSKEAAIKYAPLDYELVDDPYFGYEIHIAKTSAGWLPLFQYHRNGIASVNGYKAAYEEGCEIYDEYGTKYSWDEFRLRVLEFNGGTLGTMPRKRVEVDIISSFYDKNMPEYVPISHFEYANGMYKDEYYTDEDGYEFSVHEFS